jgi:hypothetical protein
VAEGPALSSVERSLSKGRKVVKCRGVRFVVLRGPRERPHFVVLRGEKSWRFWVGEGACRAKVDSDLALG